MCWFDQPYLYVRGYPFITLADEGGGGVRQILILANMG